MGKDRKEKEEKPKKNDFKAFLRKRAPIYLGIMGLFMLFVVPDLMKGDLESSFPELTSEEQQVMDILMKYDGPNDSGLTVIDAISMKISEEYPDEKIYDNKKNESRSKRIRITNNFDGICNGAANVWYWIQIYTKSSYYCWRS